MALLGREAITVDVDPSVVDHCVEHAVRVRLVGNALHAGRIREVSDHDPRRAIGEIIEIGRPFRRSSVEHDVMTVVKK